MKLREIKYSRPDIDILVNECEKLCKNFENSDTFEQQLKIFKDFEKLKDNFLTFECLSNIRNSINTQDPFYLQEQAFYDKYSPVATMHFNRFNKSLLESRFQNEFRKELGNYFFDCLENEQKTFSPEIIDLLSEENELCSKFENLYASARIEFDGKVLNLSQLSAYRQNPDRNVRKSAVEAEGKFFDDNRQEFEGIYDKLVKNRTEQAKRLGFNNYVEMAYVKRCRSYTIEDVEKFRKQVSDVMVKQNVTYKNMQAEKIGVNDFKFYDDDFVYPDGNAVPKHSVGEILKLTQKMFQEMSPQTKELIDLMYNNELFDIEPRNGKRAAGYCVTINNYGYPFIFFNANGTQGDIKTLTHECGHALAAFTAQKNIEYSSLRHAPVEASETHSMSMEFFTIPWHHLFFENDTSKYQKSLVLGALMFIPYSVIVDYFQQLVYLNPEWTAKERNDCWLKLEHEFRPYIDFDKLPFFSRGAGWQRQIHITCMPFYYIDYGIAQTLALQFFALFIKDPSSAFEKYMKFVEIAGQKNINETIEACGLVSPFKQGSLNEICKPIYDWINCLK